METLFIENLRTEARFDKLGNGEIMVEVRHPSAIIVHTMSKDEAISLLEWLSVATGPEKTSTTITRLDEGMTNMEKYPPRVTHWT